MKKSKKFLVTLLTLVFAMSMLTSFTTAFAAAETGRDNVKVTSHDINVGSDAQFTFDLKINCADAEASGNCQRVDKITGIGDHIKLNDQLIIDGTKCDIHQRGNMFYIYHAFVEGDTIELMQGMGFAKCGDGDAVSTPDSPKLLHTLGETYKIMKGADGKWAKVLPAGSNVKILGIKALETIPEGDVDFAKIKMEVEFESSVVKKYTENLQDDATFSQSFKFNGKTIKEINDANSALKTKLDEADVAIKVDGTGIAYTIYVDLRAKMDNLPVVKDGATTEFSIIKDFTTSTGLIIKEAYTRTYFPDAKYWVKDVSSKMVAENDVSFKGMGNDGGVGGDANNVAVSFKFNNKIYTDNGGNANFYGSIPTWIVTNATGRTVASVDKAVSDGTYVSLINNFTIDGKNMIDIQKDIQGDAAKSTAVMVHYNGNSMDVFIPAGLFDKGVDHVLVLKAGLTFPTNYAVKEDMKFTYNHTTTKFVVEPAVTGISFEKAEGSFAVGEELALNPIIAPSNAVNKAVTYASSDETVAKIENGKVLMLKLGTATITATTAEGGFTATIKINVIVKSTSITLDKTTITLDEGKTDKITATVNPADATNKDLTYKSSDESVATVDKDGNIKAIKKGTAKITVTNKDGLEATCNVTVNEVKKEEPAKKGCGSLVLPTTFGGISGGLMIALSAVALVAFSKKKTKEN